MTEDICYMSIDGRRGRQNAVDLLCSIGEKAKQDFGFGEVHVLASVAPKHKPTSVEFTKIQPISIKGYSRFVFSQLHFHTTKRFILLYQDDGFALNPQSWDPEFLDYDYIGAPWPVQFPWASQGFRVGNGGFSLRSKTLCEFCSTLKYPGGLPEDIAICVFYRHLLEERGFKFAPVELAKKFSVEYAIDWTHGVHSSFGFHGKPNLKYIKRTNG